MSGKTARFGGCCRRRWQRLAAALAVLTVMALPATAADRPIVPTPRIKIITNVAEVRGVQDPHYGDTLFHFYQGRYFSAVTTLMVSQHFGRLPVHAEEAEILRGGLFLSYGLHREAGEVFSQLIARGAPPPVRDRAWYYLAKIRYQRGLLAEADDALRRVEGTLPADVQEDRVLLHANVLMARGDFTTAATVLDGLAKGGREPRDASLYARYNLGVALVRQGEALKGAPHLVTVGTQATASEELRALRDKANVALGFSALQTGDTVLARQYLERVRLNGMLSNKALLGFGWAAAEQRKFSDALVPWTELAQRDPGDSAVLEAKLAVPYAYGELGALAQSLELYKEAIGSFDREAVRLDETVAAIRAGKLVEGLIERNPGDEMGWFWNIGDLPDLPHGAHLAPVLARHEFQEGFKNYRDLLFVARNLRQWDETLGVLRDMLANRRQAFEQRLPLVREKERALDLTAAEQRHDDLMVELDRAEREVDVAAFASARERALQERLDRVRHALEQGGDDAALAAARDRYRRVAGALLWEQSQQFPVRLWAARKGLIELQNNLGQAQLRNVALAKGQRDEPARLDAFAARIEALAARVQAMLPRVDELTRAQQTEVQDMAVAELLRQKERLASYGTQARFAVAQIYDRAQAAQEAARVSAQ